MTALLYRDDPYLLEFDAVVMGRRTHQGRPAVVLDRTAFYAESGGQPWDTGTLEGVPVVAVLEHEGEHLHVLADVLSQERVHGRVDAERRRDHRQQHHGQHLLSRALLELRGARTVSFHLGAQECTIDLDREVGEADLAAAVRRANEVVWEARPVTVRTVSRAEAERLARAVPDEAGAEVRLVEAEGFDLQACGGTHPRNTSEVGLILALGVERSRGGSRVRFVCGHRALAAAEGRSAALREAGSRLSVPPEGVPAAVSRLLAQNEEAGRRCRELQERLLEAEAERLCARLESQRASGASPAVASAVLDGWDAAALRQLAARLTDESSCVVLLAGRSREAGGGYLVFARSADLPHDVVALLQQALAGLGGKGGGRGRMAQGGCERTEGLEEALAQAAGALASTVPPR